MTAMTAIPPLVYHQPEGIYMKDVQAGDLLALDPYYGVERVVNAETVNSQNGVKCVHAQTAYVIPVPGHPPVERTRFVQRGQHEPVTRWRPLDG